MGANRILAAGKVGGDWGGNECGLVSRRRALRMEMVRGERPAKRDDRSTREVPRSRSEMSRHSSGAECAQLVSLSCSSPSSLLEERGRRKRERRFQGKLTRPEIRRSRRPTN